MCKECFGDGYVRGIFCFCIVGARARYASNLLRAPKGGDVLVGWLFNGKIHCIECTKGVFPTINFEECLDREGRIVDPVFYREINNRTLCAGCQSNMNDTKWR